MLLRCMFEQATITFGAAPPPPPTGAPPPVVSTGEPIIRFSNGVAEVPGARELQVFLNRMPGIFLLVDGQPGEKTSEAVRRVTGHYLVGDPREPG